MTTMQQQRRTSNSSTNIGGRSTSQISIYDYPEHLNPFHEDDQHKRLRFWRMSNKDADNAAKRDRSNSFSLNGLKEMWAFKSFRLKKRSSTLGINKTSESPPQLRRQTPTEAPLFASRIRHTVDERALGAGGDSFERGAGYRSSLQNVHSNGNQTIGGGAFNRNDRLRSTGLASNGYHTMHARGSITPTPGRSSLTHGLSQTSLNSTNPFDDDDDEEERMADAMRFPRAASTDNEDNVSRVTVNVVSDGAGGTRKVYRKKRRAPPPPPPRTSSIPASGDDWLDETTNSNNNQVGIAQPKPPSNRRCWQTKMADCDDDDIDDEKRRNNNWTVSKWFGRIRK